MGTQQIFMVIVSVLIVGLAIAVAISSTNNMAVTTNRSSVTGNLVGTYSRAMKFWLTPASHGGGGRESWSPAGAGENGQLEYKMVIDPHQSDYQIELLN